MHARLTRIVTRIAAAPLLATGLLAVITPAVASASACVAWTGVQPPDPGGTSQVNALSAVVARSACDAWAVGEFDSGGTHHPLIEHWDGTGWTQVASPSPAGSELLRAVAATSASDAWAVGYSFPGANAQTLIEHWDGTAWTQVASPDPGGPGQDNLLTGVAAVSASNAWAVGFYRTAAGSQALIAHWNGHAWQQVASPNPSATFDTLAAVSFTSASNAWAVGSYANAAGNQSLALIERWNGSTWQQVPVSTALDPELLAVTATSASNAWAVGTYFTGSGSATLTEHWNGHAWQRVPSPSPAGPSSISAFNGVAATSSGDAWAVGFYNASTGAQTLVAHWNGTAWQQVTIPAVGPAGSNQLRAISASSPGNAWAVGVYSDGTADQALALHCC